MMRKTSGSTQIYNLLRSFNEINNFEKLEKIVEMYKDDFDEFDEHNSSFFRQFQEMRVTGLEESTLLMRKRFFEIRNVNEKLLLSEVIILAKLVIVSPATNAVGERRFSALKRLKAYIRSTTGDNRLKHLMMIHVHQDTTGKLNLRRVINKSIAANDNRKRLFVLFNN